MAKSEAKNIAKSVWRTNSERTREKFRAKNFLNSRKKLTQSISSSQSKEDSVKDIKNNQKHELDKKCDNSNVRVILNKLRSDIPESSKPLKSTESKKNVVIDEGSTSESELEMQISPSMLRKRRCLLQDYSNTEKQISQTDNAKEDSQCDELSNENHQNLNKKVNNIVVARPEMCLRESEVAVENEIDHDVNRDNGNGNGIRIDNDDGNGNGNNDDNNIDVINNGDENNRNGNDNRNAGNNENDNEVNGNINGNDNRHNINQRNMNGVNLGNNNEGNNIINDDDLARPLDNQLSGKFIINKCN